jgi:hypothetical protein
MTSYFIRKQIEHVLIVTISTYQHRFRLETGRSITLFPIPTEERIVWPVTAQKKKALAGYHQGTKTLPACITLIRFTWGTCLPRKRV